MFTFHLNFNHKVIASKIEYFISFNRFQIMKLTCINYSPNVWSIKELVAQRAQSRFKFKLVRGSVIRCIPFDWFVPKMTPLAIGREIFTWFHVNAADVPLNTYQKIARRLFKFTFLSIYLSNVCGIVIFDMKFSSNKMESLFIIYQFGVILAVMNASIAIFTSGAKITSIFHGLSGIYNQRKH